MASEAEAEMDLGDVKGSQKFMSILTNWMSVSQTIETPPSPEVRAFIGDSEKNQNKSSMSQSQNSLSPVVEKRAPTVRYSMVETNDEKESVQAWERFADAQPKESEENAEQGEIKYYLGQPVKMRSKSPSKSSMSKSSASLTPSERSRPERVRYSMAVTSSEKDKIQIPGQSGKLPVRPHHVSAPLLTVPSQKFLNFGRPRDDGEENGEENDDFDTDSLGTQMARDIAKSRSSRRGSLTPSLSDMSDFLAQYHPRKRVSSKFDSLDYNTVESQRFIQEQEKLRPKQIQQDALLRWAINFLVGACVATIAIIVYLAIKYMSKLKFAIIYHYIEDCSEIKCLVIPTVIWAAINMVLVFIGSCFVTFKAPMAAGSGIPQIKCYLNGIKLPGLLSMTTLVAKAGGVVLSVVGGLACGKEGPMIHSGAICASCISNGKFRCGNKSWKLKRFESMRADEERRDFVAAGAASGVAAAFASPIGGVLFSLEEGASFLKQMLTWRMLFSSVVASLLYNIVMGAIKGGHAADMSNPGLVTLGYIGKISFLTYEIPIFMAMALFGGLSGSLFIAINYKLTLFRRRSLSNKWVKVIEATMIAGVSALLFVILIYAVPNCSPIRGFPMNQSTTSRVEEDHVIHKRAAETGADLVEEVILANGSDAVEYEHNIYGLHGSHGYVFRGFCPYGYHNRMADVLFKTGEGGLHAMIHGDVDEWELIPLVVLFICYMLLATWTYGISVSSGVFIPSLLIGALWGRIVGIVVMKYIPGIGTNIAKYVIVGAACQLGGTVRMTISLTVILIECTGDVTFSIPIMVSLILAKWMGDFIIAGIYDLHIEIMGIPLLPWDSPEMCYLVQANEVMTTPVVSLRLQERVGRLAKILEYEHNGFPVVDDYDPDRDIGSTYGRLKGFILKSQLRQILEGEDGTISEDELTGTVDLRMHMDRNPFSVQENVSLPRIFKLFRGLGLRHLVVVNDSNRVTGMITRINLARFRSETVRGHFKVEELDVQDN